MTIAQWPAGKKCEEVWHRLKADCGKLQKSVIKPQAVAKIRKERVRPNKPAKERNWKHIRTMSALCDRATASPGVFPLRRPYTRGQRYLYKKDDCSIICNREIVEPT